MNIGGALGIIGPSLLSAYAWGPSVVAIVNSHLAADQQITLADGGTHVAEKIMALDETVQNSILAIDIGPLEGTVSAVDSKRNLTFGIVVTVGVFIALVSIYSLFWTGAISGGANSSTLDTVLKYTLEFMKIALGVSGNDPAQ